MELDAQIGKNKTQLVQHAKLESERDKLRQECDRLDSQCQDMNATLSSPARISGLLRNSMQQHLEEVMILWMCMTCTCTFTHQDFYSNYKAYSILLVRLSICTCTLYVHMYTVCTQGCGHCGNIELITRHFDLFSLLLSCSSITLYTV